MAAYGSLLPARGDASRPGFLSASAQSDYFLPVFDVATSSFLIAIEERVGVW